MNKPQLLILMIPVIFFSLTVHEYSHGKIAFLLGDNTDYPDAIFVIHTDFPRFIINLANDEVEWLEEFDKNEENELLEETQDLIEAANAFYDREVERYEE